MSNTQTDSASGENPQTVLGVPPNAGEKEIRAAYLNKIKQYPPDRNPEEFEKIRDAFQILSNPRHRAQIMMAAGDPLKSLESLLDEEDNQKKFIGPEPWLDALKKLKKKV